MKSVLRTKQTVPPNPLWEQILHNLSRLTKRDHWNPRRSTKAAPPRRSQRFHLEAVEPRLLMSADLSYASSVHDFTLRAANPGNIPTLNLLDTNNLSSAPIATVTLGAGQTTITIERGTTPSLNADTVRIDLTTFASIDSFVGPGKSLGIAFAGSSNILKTDHLFVDGGASSTLTYGLTVTSDSDITVDGTAAFGGDVTLKSEQIQTGGAVPGTGLLANATSSIVVNGASLSAAGHTMTLDSHSMVTVNDTGLGGKAVSGSVVTSQSTAGVDIHAGSVLQAGDIAITSEVDGSLTASVSDASVAVKLLAVGGYARPEVTIDGGSHVTAANSLTIKAASIVTTSAVAMTVATNMAGRGTDIRLASGVAELGGLHVILTEYHDSRRIDRQLFGRCARQGNPGSCQAIVSLEDELFVAYAARATRAVQRLGERGLPRPAAACQGLRRLAQASAERRGAAMRMQNLKLDRRMDQTLAFSGQGE